MSKPTFALAATVMFIVFAYGIPIENLDRQKAEQYLERFGYINQPNNGTNALKRKLLLGPDEAEFTKAVRDFQKFANLTETGDLDSQTMAKMAKPRCGVRDRGLLRMMTANDGFQRPFTRKWNKMDLTYAVEHSDRSLSFSEERVAVSKAFKLWSDASELRFRELPAEASDADIRISFGAGFHNDPWPFDGPGGILAHALLPSDGRAHFDADERWFYSETGKLETSSLVGNRIQHEVNFYPVVTHELGHSLGLEHSEFEDAVMAPFYKEMPEGQPLALHSDDVRQLRSLYGHERERTASPTTRPTSTSTRLASPTTRTPRPITPDLFTRTKRPFWQTTRSAAISTRGSSTTIPFRTKPTEGSAVVPGEDDSKCFAKITAVIDAPNGKTYIVAADRIWQNDAHFTNAATATVNSIFSPGPASVTAGLASTVTGAVLLFSGRDVWTYYWNSQSLKFVPEAASPKKLPAEISITPKAAFQFKDGNQIIVQDNAFVTYDEAYNHATLTGKLTDYFAGLPANGKQLIFRLKDRLYFYSDDRFMEYNESSMKPSNSDSRIDIRCQDVADPADAPRNQKILRKARRNRRRTTTTRKLTSSARTT